MSGDLVMYHTFAVPAFMFAAGIALSFFGSRLVPFALVICALVLGFLHGGSFLLQFTDNADVIRFGPIILAVLLAVLVSFLYRIAFFLAGFFIGFFALSALFPDLALIYTGALALAAGALVYVSRNFVFSVLTALMGAGLTATGAVNLLAWVNVSAGITTYWSIVVIMFIAGTVYQIKRRRRGK